MLTSKLSDLGVSILDSDKYYTYCPKCGDSRSKHNSKSLMVVRTDNYIRLKCLHADQCEWNKTQYIKGDDMKDYNRTRQVESRQVFIPEGIELPIEDDFITYPYKDVDGNIQFYVVRTPDKKFYPLTYTEDGDFTMKAWKGKSLYGAETLDKDKPVIVVEGEKAADAARKIFTKASVVCWVGGANSINRGDWDLLDGYEVTLWPDNDRPGVAAMEKVASVLVNSDVYMVDVSSLPEKHDLADDIPKDTIKKLYHSRTRVNTFSMSNTINKENFLEAMSKVTTGLSLGWSSVDKALRLPQSGLVIIGGRSGHGKTTLMLNIAVNLLKQTDRKIVHYSYEIPAHRMLLKLLMCWEGEEKSSTPTENEELYREALKEDTLESWHEVKDLLDNRLYLSDDPCDIDTLVETLDQKHLEDAVVFVDYIQLIPSKSASSRYLVIKEHADALRAVANKRNQVIITGSQLTDGETPYQDSVREGKDIQNAAELVLKVWNKTIAEAQEIMKKASKEEGGLKHYYDQVGGNFALDVVKNRNGEPGKKVGFNLKFGALLVPVNPDDNYPEF